MALSNDPLILGRIIGEVVDTFVPSINMSVRYGPKHVTNGCDIKPFVTIDQPKITINGKFDEHYTLVMIDPDSPSPSEPFMREWLQWMVVDIPGGTSVSRGEHKL